MSSFWIWKKWPDLSVAPAIPTSESSPSEAPSTTSTTIHYHPLPYTTIHYRAPSTTITIKTTINSLSTVIGTLLWNLWGVHVKDLHETKLVENCTGGKYLHWQQTLQLDLTRSILVDLLWDSPSLNSKHVPLRLSEWVKWLFKYHANIASLFPACSSYIYQRIWQTVDMLVP